MKKLLTLMLFVIALNQTMVKAQCPPGAFAYQSLYPQCPSGCGVLLLGWPEGVLVNIYGGTPLTIITSTTISGTLGGGGTGDAFTCVPCNTPLVFASTQNGATSGCVIATIGVVPVKITRFNATASANSCRISWTSASETGTVKYTIQKSYDGRSFTDAATITGKQLPINDYSFTDASVNNSSAYYRVKVTELSGNTFYTETALVKLQQQFGFSIYPNPANDAFKLNIPASFLPAQVEVVNAQGVRLLTKTISQPVSAINDYLPKGIYAIKVTGSNSQTATQRLVKN